MAIAKRQVDVALANDSTWNNLRTEPANSEWFRVGTIIGSANGTATATVANLANKRHVLHAMGVTFENTISSGVVKIVGLPSALNVYMHAGGGEVSFYPGILCAANTTVSASVLSAGASVNTGVWLRGRTVPT